MKLTEWWSMYLEVSQLWQIGLNVSQIGRKLGITRNTVYKYMGLSPDEFQQYIQERSTRRKKLHLVGGQVLAWLKEFPDLSAAQVMDWLLEKDSELKVCEGTVRNYVGWLRKEHDIPKVIQKRQYEAVEDPPMGQQLQVDFGETSLKNTQGNLVKLRFIAFVLAHSRCKYVEWLDRPFTSADVIKAHENAFAFFGGLTREIVYDQDHLILVSENNGDLIFTREFAAYVKKQKFQIHMCRKQDPESKGRIENVVGFVKKNFAKHRTFHNLDKLNEECLAWLDRTGNGKEHNTTKKIPAEVFVLEKQHLRPTLEKIEISCTNSITRQIRKDNTVRYKANRYSLPFGTYNGKDQDVVLEVTDDNLLVIYDQENGREVARHPISFEKGKLIQNTNHRRDRSKGIDNYLDTVSDYFNDPVKARTYLEQIRTNKPRYIRDQLQFIQQHIHSVDKQLAGQALDFCLKNKLFSAVDFVDTVKHFGERYSARKTAFETKPPELKPLDELDRSKLKTKPQVRDIKVYQQLMNGGYQCQA
ncbi:MAG: IS21 family transposase [Thermincolia bacterium]